MFRQNGSRATLLLTVVLSLALSASAQSPPSITLSGVGSQPLTLTATDLAAMPRASVTTNNNGIAIVYEGVWLSDILKKAGMTLGESLRGAALASYLLASASDGYQVLFSIGELDPEMTDNQFLLADKSDGKALFGSNGSFRLVVPKDKRGARSVRMLTKLEVVQLRK